MFARREDEVGSLSEKLREERAFLSREYIDRLESDPVYGSHRNRFVNWLQHDFPLLCLACYREAVIIYRRRGPTVTAIFDVEFTNTQILLAGLSLGKSLNYKILAKTPFAYLSFFCSTMYQSSYLPEAIDYVMESMAVTSLLYYRPSLIAAAAVMAAHTTIKHSRISREDVSGKLHTVTEVGRIDVDAVFSCYSRMVNWRNQRNTGLMRGMQDPRMRIQLRNQVEGA